jgi:hypothetical protein
MCRHAECPSLDTALREIATAADPAAAAAERSVALVDGRVRVVIELAPEASLPADAPLVVEAQYEHLVQALVAPEQLCSLAANPAIARIRLPFPRAPDPRPPAGPALP